MKKELFLVLAAIVGLFSYFHPSYALTYPQGFTFIQVPTPRFEGNPPYPLVPMNVPFAGQSFYDPWFGTVLTRVTEINGINGRHEYSRIDPFNVDQSLIILLLGGDNDWRVYRIQSMPYNQVSNLVMTLNDAKEPRWDPTNPYKLWYLQGFCVMMADLPSREKTTIKDFSTDPSVGLIIAAHPDLYRIAMMDEGESSLDKRYWAFLLQGTNEDYRVRYLFTWDREQDRVLGLYPIPAEEAAIDWVGMSPLGNWVLIGGDYSNGGKLSGLTMANKELTQFHRLDYSTAHSDVGLDSEGKEVIVMQNVRTDYIDLIPIDLNTKPMLTAADTYANTNRTPLIRLYYNADSPIGLNSGVHISCNVSGYGVVSTTTPPGVAEQNWLDRTIALVRLDRDNPQVFYLAKVYGTTSTYWEETHASITNDGKKVVWASNWNQNVGEEKLFLVQLDMPSNWREVTAPLPDLNPTGLSTTITALPQLGTPVTLTVSAQAPEPSYYRFFIGGGYGASWTEIQPWSTSNSCTYTPFAEDNYVFVAHVSDSMLGERFHQAGFSFATANHSEAGVIVTGLTSDLRYPHPKGTPLNLLALAVGNEAIYYKFWHQHNSGAWQVIRDWSSDNSAVWTPDEAGDYVVVVWGSEFAAGGEANPPLAGLTCHVTE